jgi:hypothetical protein
MCLFCIRKRPSGASFGSERKPVLDPTSNWNRFWTSGPLGDPFAASLNPKYKSQPTLVSIGQVSPSKCTSPLSLLPLPLAQSPSQH